jgi:hypothetical protein
MLRTMLLAGMAALLAVSFPLLYERKGDLDALSGTPAPQPETGTPALTVGFPVSSRARPHARSNP